jgi:hypothetical protein
MADEASWLRLAGLLGDVKTDPNDDTSPTTELKPTAADPNVCPKLADIPERLPEIVCLTWSSWD